MYSRYIFLIFIMYLWPRSYTFPSNKEDTNNVADVEIEFKHHGQKRTKRSIDEHDNIDVFIKAVDETLILKLSRVRRDIPDPRLFSSSKQGIVEEKGVSNVNKSLYHDLEKSAAVTIQWKNGEATEIHGTFVHNDKVFFIKPMSNATESDNRVVDPSFTPPIIHRMTSSDILIDYFRDAVDIGNNLMASERLENPGSEDSSALTSTDLFVEYVIVADYKNYQNWADMTDSSVPQQDIDGQIKHNMVEFYQHIVNGIDVIFKTANSARYNISIIFAGIVIFNHTRTPPWTDQHAVCPGCNIVDDYLVLKSFSEWSWIYLQNIIKHDHAALFTGFDLYYSTLESAKTIGLSYMSNMCGNYSVSVIEEKRNALSAHVAAHELGHNFGATHDGKGVASVCSEDDKYLMASKMSRVENPIKARNPWTFSPCSRASIYDYIDRLTKNNKNCLLGIPKEPGIPHAQQAGEIYTADRQCQAMYGKDSFVCRNVTNRNVSGISVAYSEKQTRMYYCGLNMAAPTMKHSYHHTDWTKICYGLACWNPDDKECQLIYPHDGTACSNRKWCQQGFCVHDERAITLDDSCPFGDAPAYYCSIQDCQEGSFTLSLCCSYCKKFTTVSHSSTSTTWATQTTPTLTTTRKITTIPSTTRTAATAIQSTTTQNVTTRTLTTTQNATTATPSTTQNATTATSSTTQNATTATSLTTKQKATTATSSTTTRKATTLTPSVTKKVTINYTSIFPSVTSSGTASLPDIGIPNTTKGKDGSYSNTSPCFCSNDSPQITKKSTSNPLQTTTKSTNDLPQTTNKSASKFPQTTQKSSRDFPQTTAKSTRDSLQITVKSTSDSPQTSVKSTNPVTTPTISTTQNGTLNSKFISTTKTSVFSKRTTERQTTANSNTTHSDVNSSTVTPVTLSSPNASTYSSLATTVSTPTYRQPTTKIQTTSGTNTNDVSTAVPKEAQIFDLVNEAKIAVFISLLTVL